MFAASAARADPAVGKECFGVAGIYSEFLFPPLLSQPLLSHNRCLKLRLHEFRNYGPRPIDGIRRAIPTQTDTRHEFFNSANPLMSMRYLKKSKVEVKIEEWKSNLPSEMTIGALEETVCDLRNGEIPDGNKQILKKYLIRNLPQQAHSMSQ